MSWLRRLAASFRGRRLDDELEEEMRFHLEMRAEDNAASGMQVEEARREAIRRFGNRTLMKERTRAADTLAWVDSLGQDLRYAVRVMRRAPLFTAMAVLALGVAIGINTAVFSGYNAVMLRPVPVPDPRSLVRLSRWYERENSHETFPQAKYDYFRENARALSAVLGETDAFGFAVGPGGGERATGMLVTGNYFNGLGVPPAAGRAFAPGDEGQPFAVISSAYWRRRFQSDAGIAGRTLLINGVPFTIAGVMPPGFIGAGEPPLAPDVWAPLWTQQQLGPRAEPRELRLIGRLNPGATPEGAASEIRSLAARFESADGAPARTLRVTVKRAAWFRNAASGGFTSIAAVAMAAAASILLLACANLANMMLSRAEARRAEIGMRCALGAGRGRIVRQLLTESLLISSAGGALGLLLAGAVCRGVWALVVEWVETTTGERFPLAIDLSADVRVFAYVLALAAGAAVLFGLFPALESLKASPELRPRRSRLRHWLAAAQVAVSLVLLVTACLLARGLARSRAAHPGFETRGLLTMYVDTFGLGYKGAQAEVLLRNLAERLEALPQIASVGLTTRPPLSRGFTVPFRLDGFQRRLPSRALFTIVSSGYFETLGIPIVQGRNFSPEQARQHAPVAVVSQATARLFWPGEDALGKRIRLLGGAAGASAPRGAEPPSWRLEVIGVARDVRTATLTRVDPTQIYVPGNQGSLVARSRTDPGKAIEAVRADLQQFDPKLAAHIRIGTLERGELVVERMLAKAGVIFGAVLAAVALLLAATGIFGVMAYGVSRRTREIGIRVALGAGARDVLRGILHREMMATLAGCAAGLLGALGVARLLAAVVALPDRIDLLFGGSAADPLAFAAACVTVVGAAALAAYVPARRALHVDPIEALRCE